MAAPENRDQQVLMRRVRSEMLAPRRIQRVHNRWRRRQAQFQIVNGVADELIARAESADLQNSRVGDFGSLFGELEFRLPLAARIPDRGEFIHAAESGLVVSRDQPGPYAPDV